MKLTRLRLIGFKSFVEPTDFLIEPGLTGVVGPNGCGKSNLVEALALGDGREFAQIHARGRHGSGDFRGLRQPPGAQQCRSVDGDRQFRSRRRRPPSTNTTRSKSPAASSASRARPIASTAAKCAPATCRSCSPTPRPARVRPRSCIRAASARSSRPSPSSAAACWKRPPAFPACMRAATRPNCGCAPPSRICSGWKT